MCILALTKMLYPLQYMFPVIPLLPTSLPNAEQVSYSLRYQVTIRKVIFKSTQTIAIFVFLILKRKSDFSKHIAI